MFVPIYDDNPLRIIARPIVTWLLILANVVIFAFQVSGIGGPVTASFAIVPAELFGAGIVGAPAAGPHDLLAVPEAYTLVTYMFFHGDVLHLAGNMLFLWVFGDNVEDALGHLRFLIFYLACGVAGALVHAAMAPTSGIPLIGASAAVAGVVVAYLLIYPRVLVWVLVLRFIPLRVNAAFALGAWILLQLFMAIIPMVLPDSDIGPVAWWAHVGGIVAGAALIFVLRPTREQPLGGGGVYG